MKTSFLLLLFAWFTAASCGDDDLQPRPNETPLEALNRLVPPTQTGAGTFGCLVNGELWIPEVDGITDIKIDALLTPSNFLQIVALKEPISDMRDQSISMTSQIIVNQKTDFAGGTKFEDGNAIGDCIFIDHDTTFTNYVEVLYVETTNQIVSGRFVCTMQEPDCPDTKIKITEGRFDLKYRF